MPLAEMFVSSILEFWDLSQDIPRSWAKKLGQAELYVDSDGEKPEDPNNAVAAGRALSAVAGAAAAAASANGSPGQQ